MRHLWQCPVLHSRSLWTARAAAAPLWSGHRAGPRNLLQVLAVQVLRGPQKLPTPQAAAYKSMPEAQMVGMRIALAEVGSRSHPNHLRCSLVDVAEPGWSWKYVAVTWTPESSVRGNLCISNTSQCHEREKYICETGMSHL